MTILRLPEDKDWINLNNETGLSKGEALLIRNYSTKTIFITHSSTKPEEGVSAYPLLSNESVVTEDGKESVWVRGDSGIVWVESQNDSISKTLVLAEFPSDLYTGGSEGISRRIRVDVGQTGFWAGREFRSYYEMNIPSGDTVNLKFSSSVNFILWEQSLNLDTGGRRASAHVGATIGGSWTPLDAVGRNRMTDRPTPYYVPQASLSSGGTFSGGTEVEVIRVKTGSNQCNQRSSTVGGRQFDERGLPPGDYIISLAPLTGVDDAATGIYSIEWEERP